MANSEHLMILKQGVEAWNRWRDSVGVTTPNLDGAQLKGWDLRKVNFSSCSLDGVDLRGADLRKADLMFARIRDADLARADIWYADLRKASAVNSRFSRADLRGALLRECRIQRCSFRNARLTRADFQNSDVANIELSLKLSPDKTRRAVDPDFWAASLENVDFSHADLSGCNLGDASFVHSELQGSRLENADLRRARFFNVNVANATFGGTLIGPADLSGLKGLDQVKHHGPSLINPEKLHKLQSNVEQLLKGCGFSDWEIEAAKLYDPNLTESKRIDIAYQMVHLQSQGPIQINPLFISYAHADASFVEILEKQLDNHHIRYWRDVHDMKAGRLERQIDQAIRHNPTVLLVLSERSVESDWVRWEAQKARELEKEIGRDVLCPLALDDGWKRCNWPGWLRAQIEDYYILDFSERGDLKAMDRQFHKLIEGLESNYSNE